jgi:hypothetical protein
MKRMAYHAANQNTESNKYFILIGQFWSMKIIQEKLEDAKGPIRSEDYFWPYKTFVLYDFHTPKLSNQNEVFI